MKNEIALRKTKPKQNNGVAWTMDIKLLQWLKQVTLYLSNHLANFMLNLGHKTLQYSFIGH